MRCGEPGIQAKIGTGQMESPTRRHAILNRVSQQKGLAMKCLPMPLAALAIVLSITACSKLTPENYAKIQIGMDYPAVTDILGKPDRCSDIAGFKSCQWGTEQRGVTIRFVGEKVVLQSAENIR